MKIKVYFCLIFDIVIRVYLSSSFDDYWQYIFFSNAEAEDNPPLAQIIDNRVFVNISLDDDDDDDDNMCREPWGL